MGVTEPDPMFRDPEVVAEAMRGVADFIAGRGRPLDEVMEELEIEPEPPGTSGCKMPEIPTPYDEELDRLQERYDETGDDEQLVAWENKQEGYRRGVTDTEAKYAALVAVADTLVDYDNETPDEHKVEFVNTELICQLGAALAALRAQEK